METILVSVPRQGQKNREELEQYVGLKHAFPDPFHLYLHVRDLSANESGISKSPIIRFIVFSMGKKKIAMTGYYRRRKGKSTYSQGESASSFHITYACKYLTRDLHTYVTKWGEEFINTLNITKDRVNKRIQALLGNPPSPILKDENDYLQLKAWLSTQPLSSYYRSDLNIEKLKSIITPEYHKRLRDYIPEFSSIDYINKEITMNILSDIDSQQLQEDVESLMETAIEKLDKLLSNYENHLNILQYQSNSKDIMDISEQFYNWISVSKYSSDSWYSSLESCECNSPSDPGCQIITWGEDISLV